MPHKTHSDVVSIHLLVHTILINTMGRCDSGFILSEVLICKLSEDGNIALSIFRFPEESNLH